MQIQRYPERKSCCLSTSLDFAADFLQEAMHDDDVRGEALRQFHKHTAQSTENNTTI